MATVRAFRALHPTAASASQVAAVPYDVVDTEEARGLAAGNPLSFLHVSRAEIDLPAGTDPHADIVYRTAAARYDTLKRDAPLLQEQRPSIYLYRLESGGHAQTGVAACFSVDEYDRDVIRKHERTRQDKEDDRTRHIVELRAQTGPVFLIHRPNGEVDELARRIATEPPLIDFRASDSVRHAIWRAGDAAAESIAAAFSRLPALYIADGHHRAASAARARKAVANSEEAAFFLAVAFPSDQVRILPYNRVVRDLNGRTAESYLEELGRTFSIRPGTHEPRRKGETAMYLGGAWYAVDLGDGARQDSDPGSALDCNLLQERLLTPILGIKDIRSDPRVEFVGGATGSRRLEQVVDSGRMAVAFSMYPVSVTELMEVSDAGQIMPPKSTWFEPKLRDGLLIHEL